MNEKRAILQPLEAPWDPDIEHLLAAYPRHGTYLLTLFRVIARSARFLKKGTLNLLDRDSPLPLRERELVILRVCANNGCEYEWGVHVAIFAGHAGFTDEQVRATVREGPHATCWSGRESVLLAAVDQQPRALGLPFSNWTTAKLANYLAKETGVAITPRRVEHYLKLHGWQLRRPVRTVKHKQDPDLVAEKKTHR